MTLKSALFDRLTSTKVTKLRNLTLTKAGQSHKRREIVYSSSTPGFSALTYSLRSTYLAFSSYPILARFSWIYGRLQWLGNRRESITANASLKLFSIHLYCQTVARSVVTFFYLSIRPYKGLGFRVLYSEGKWCKSYLCKRGALWLPTDIPTSPVSRY